MKRVIFTSYDDITGNTDLDHAAKVAVEEYFDRLVANKKEYAKLVGADFILYHNKMDEWLPEELEFTKVNLYKHHLMASLAEEYDEVMYVDMDVVFNTTENVFEVFDLSKGIVIKDQDDAVKSKDHKKIVFRDVGARNPTLKYHITKDLLGGKDNHVLNTGIMIAKSEHIRMIQYIDRLPGIIKKIEKKKNAKNSFSTIREFYYPNNESIFSYILEHYKIPYQIMDAEWHDIRDDSHTTNEKDSYGKLIHFINKGFHAFFKDKTRAIFSLYIKIEDQNLDNPGTYAGDTMNKSKRTQLKLETFYDQLIKTKTDYAEAVDADFFLFERDDQYAEFAKNYSYMSEYNIVNLYKIYLLDQLCKKYDHVLYLDFDVHCRKTTNIFNTLNCDYFMMCQFNYPEEVGIKTTKDYFDEYKYDFRSPHSKYWNAHALLNEYDLDPNNNVFNTGIILSSKKVMEKLGYFDDLDEILELMTELKEDSMYPEKIQEAFGYDNETIFSFKIIQNEVPVRTFDNVWHWKHYGTTASSLSDASEVKKHMLKQTFNNRMSVEDPIFVHFISKQLELVYEE